MGEPSDPIASSTDVWIVSRAAATRSIMQTKQTGTLAAPGGIRSHSLSPLGAQKAVRGIASGWMIGLLSPTHGQRSQQQSGQITLQSVLINESKFLKATHRTKIRKIEIPRSMVVEALS